MKFSNGYWNLREGVSLYSPAEVGDIMIDESSMTVYAPDKHIKNKGATLNRLLLTIRFSSPAPDIICVQVFHYKGGMNNSPEFILYKQDEPKIEIGNGADLATLRSGNLQVEVCKTKGWGVDFFYKGQRITGTGLKNLGYITSADKQVYMREQLALGVGEHVYGLGERFTSFVKNGQVVDMWNEDGGTSSELAYKNIPFYVTNKRYGVFVNHPERVSFEVASEVVSRVQFSVPGEYLEYYIIGGDTLKDVLRNYTELTGRPALPPAWSFGLWLTTSFTTDYDEKTINSFINGMAERDLPLSVFHFDCFWMKEYQWCDFEWDTRTFPDPEGMLKHLKEKGLKTCVWINPYIAQKSRLFDEGLEKGYLIKKADGSVWQCDIWQAGMGIVDFTNPLACIWYADKLRRLVDMGVDCFKTGERIPTDVVYSDGSDPIKMHNYYTYLYNKVVFNVLEGKYGKGNAAVFARSATVGGQMFPVHWGGDCSATYESMAETLCGGLSLGMSGFGFWSHDISGFENTATPDLYKRWTAFGMLSSHSRLHGNISYRVPWLFDDESVDVLRFFTKLKYSLMPYLFNAAYEASQNGIPMMRPMVLEFIDDPACDFLDRQYMLGESVMVAPVFSENGSVQYYLPQGKWTNFITGERIEGGVWRKERHNYMSLPIMIRPNSVIAVGGEDNKPDYDYADGVTLQVFEIQEGNNIITKIYDKNCKIELEVNIGRKGNTVTVESQGSTKPWYLLMRGIREIQPINGEIWEQELIGVRIIPVNRTFGFNII